MAEQWRFTWNPAGFREILTGPGVQGVVTDAAERIVANARAGSPPGAEYSANVKRGNYGGGRYVGFVSTANRAADMAEAQYKTLSQAVR